MMNAWKTMLSVLLSLLIVIAVAGNGVAAYSKAESVQKGSAYLQIRQIPDGSFGTDGLTARDTAAACRALSGMNPDAETTTKSLLWLRSHDIEGVEPLARAMEAFQTAAQQNPAITQKLQSFLQETTTFGSFSEFQPNILDTALAIRALARDVSVAPAILAAAVNYIKSSQNADGGWGYVSGDLSDPYISSIAAGTLAELKGNWDVAASLDPALGYISGQLQGDGSIADSPLFTAEALRAFTVAERQLPASTASPIDYLLTAQLPDGSWESDVFITSEIMQSLMQVNPDLSISADSVVLSNLTPSPGETLTITAVVNNLGSIDAGAFMTAFYDSDPDSGGILLGEVQVNGIAAYSEFSVSFNFQISGGAGQKEIYIVLDPGGIVDPMKRGNNRSSVRYTVRSASDLAVSPACLSFTPGNPQPGDAVDVGYAIYNLGEGAAANVVVDIYDGDPASGGILLHEGTVSSIIGGGMETGNFTATFSEGTHSIHAVIDPADVIFESSENNNTSYKALTVSNNPSNIDLSISSAAMTLTPIDPQPGGSVSISASVANLGTEATGARIDFYDGSQVSGVLIGTRTVAVPAGGSVTASIDYILLSTTTFFTAVVDPANDVAETDETNNSAVKAISTTLPDLTLSAEDISLSANPALSGMDIMLSAKVHNEGAIAANDVQVEFFKGNPSSGGTKIGVTQVIPSVEPAEYSEVSVAYDNVIVGQYQIYAVIDRIGQIVETDENNNQDRKSLSVIASNSPDLFVDGIVVNGSIIDPDTLEMTGSVRLRIGNAGYYQCTADFYVSIYEDSERDMRFDSLSEKEFGRALVTATVPKNGYVEIEIPVSGVLGFSSSIVAAMAESTSAIYEVDESNNSLDLFSTCTYESATVTVAGQCDLWLAGQPVGTILSTDRVGDDATPKQRAQNTGLTCYPNQIIFISATGATSYQGNPSTSSNGPDGMATCISRGGALGISAINTGWNSLTGVFLGDNAPDPNATPGELPYPGKSKTPEIQQAVKIGAGPTTMVVPEGATRLFLGSHDSPGTNYNNGGEFNVKIRVSDGPDLVPGYLRLDSTLYPDSIGIVVRLGNGSDGFLGAGNGSVSFYDGDPAGGGVLLGSVGNSAAIPAGGYEDLRFTWTTPPPGEHIIYVIADADNVVQECNETNNSTFKTLTIGTTEETLPNIAAGAISIVQDPQYEGQDYDIVVKIANTRSVDVSNVAVSLYDGDPVSGGLLIGSEMLVSVPAYGEGGVQFKWDCSDLGGVHFLHVVVDPNNIIEEENELDNSAFITVNLLSPLKPDLIISSADISFSPSTPTQGDSLAVGVTVKNSGAPVSDISVSLYLDGDLNSGLLLQQQVMQTILQTGETAALSFIVADASMTGTHWVCAYVDPANTIEELNEENNHGEVEFLVRSGMWQTTVTTDKGTYNPGEDADISVAVTNLDSSAKDAGLSVVVLNQANEPIAFLSPLDPHEWNAQETLTFSFIFDTAANLGGTYKVRAVILENDTPRDQAFASFGINAIPLISSSLATDRAVYSSRRPVILTAAVINSSVNYFFENLTAYVDVVDPNSLPVAHYQEEMGDLMPSAVFNFQELWNTGINPPGAYTANLTVKDASDNLITFSTATITIIGSGSAGLTGTLTATPSTVAYPEDVQFDYAVTNTGNSEFNGIIHVKVVDPSTSSIVRDFTETTTIPTGATISGSFTLDGNVLSGSNYTVGLSAEDGNGTKSLNAAAINVTDVMPPILTAQSPQAGTCVNGQTAVSARATDDHSGVALVEARFDNSSEWLQMALVSGTSNDGIYDLTYMPQTADEGSRTVEIRAVDADGNGFEKLSTDANPINIGFSVDITPPAVTVSSPSEGETVTPGFVPSIQGTDANAITWTNYLDGNPYMADTPIVTAGSHTLTVTATDACGNLSPQITRQFTVRETTPPQAEIIAPVAGSCVSGQIAVSARVIDDGSGVAYVEFKPDNHSAWDTMSLSAGNSNDGIYSALYTPVAADEGGRIIEVRAVDLAGNNCDTAAGDSNPAYTSFIVDITPPAVSVNSPSEGATVLPGFVPDIQGSDVNGVVWSVLLDGSAYALGTPIDAEGAHVLAVSASDGCGNQSAQVTRNFTVEEEGGNPALPVHVGCFAWFGCDSMTVNGNTRVYGVSSVGGTQGSGGNIGTNGPIVVNGSNIINGDAYYGPGQTLTINGSQSQILGARIQMTDAVACGGDLLSDWVSYAQDNNLNAQVSSQYLNSSRNFTLNGNKTCTLNAGVYYFNNVTINGTSKLVANGQVAIVCTGIVTINGNSKVNQASIPSNLTLIVSSASAVTLNGNAGANLVAFAPLSQINVNGNLAGNGNLWGQTFVGNGSVVWNRVIGGECP